jgi:hypothetical protein
VEVKEGEPEKSAELVEVITAAGEMIQVPPGLVEYILTPEAKQEIIRQANEVATAAEGLQEESTDAEATTCSIAAETYSEWLKGEIVGKTTGARVNVRPEPGLDAATSAYGLVGDDVAVIAVEPDDGCQPWYRVQFPESGWQGWVYGDHVRINHE